MAKVCHGVEGFAIRWQVLAIGKTRGRWGRRRPSDLDFQKFGGRAAREPLGCPFQLCL